MHVHITFVLEYVKPVRNVISSFDQVELIPSDDYILQLFTSERKNLLRRCNWLPENAFGPDSKV